MRELALHIMDIIENSLDAEATLITLSIAEDSEEKVLRISIKDDGRGIPKSMLEQITDPFVTTRTTRRVGLGLSMFKESAKRCGGEFDICSEQGKGTAVCASFRTDHIDSPPLGDMAGSLISLIMTHPEVDFVYTHEADCNRFEMDTRQIKEELDDVPIYHPEVMTHITRTIRESLEELKAGKQRS